MSPPVTPATERFERHFTRSEKGCWDWQAFVNSAGYGTFSVSHRRSTYAHRFAYETFVGPIPEGLEIDHLCRNRSCVNPAHLEAVTPRENTLRGETITARHSQKTHCDSGHPFTEANTYVRPTGGRGCHECRRAAVKRYRAKRVTA